MPIASRDGARRFHSFFASASSHDGHLIVDFGGTGSCSLSGCLPGLPSSIFSAVGLGFLPLVAISGASFQFNLTPNTTPCYNYSREVNIVSSWDKLINRILSLDKNLRFDELRKVLEEYGYTMIAPRSGSSHYTFRKPGCSPITIPKHEPIKKVYVEMVRNVVESEMKMHEND